MITNRKGLSDVVTTVLIILLVLAAVVIVGNYVLQLVSKGGEKISGATTCTSLQVAPINCSYIFGPVGTYVLGLTAKKSGVDANIKELKLVLTKADGTTTTATAASIPIYLETSTVYTASASATKAYSKVSLVPTITTDSGEVVTCSETAKIDCIG